MAVVLQHLQVAEIHVFFGTANVEGEALQASEQLQAFLTKRLGNGRVLVGRVDYGNVTLSGKGGFWQTGIVNGYLVVSIHHQHT